MGFPEGMQLANVTFGIPLTVTGKDVIARVTVKPTARVIWAATGQPLPEFPDSFTAEVGQLGEFQVPFIDQPGFIDSTGATVTDFAYQITGYWRFGNERPINWTKNLKPLVGQSGPINLDLISDGPVAVPVTAPTAAVLGFGGRTGFVALQESDLPTRLSDSELAATYGKRQTLGSMYAPMLPTLFPASMLAAGGVTFTPTVPTFTSLTGTLWPACDAMTRQHGALTLTDVAGAGRNMLDGSLTQAAYDREFWLDGSHVALMYSGFEGGDWQVHIDDQPVTFDPQKITASNSYFLDIPFAAPGLHKIRVTTARCDIIQILMEKNDTVYPAAKRFNLGILADSWGQGSTGYLAGAIPQWIAAETGFAVWRNCQGGTGYHNVTVSGQDFTTYGSPDRVAALAAQPLDALLVYGSFNDGDQEAATLEADATATYAAIKAVMPDLPIIVAGWQPYYNGDAAADAKSQGIKNAALAAANVRGFIDWRGSVGDGTDKKWITGTGTIAEPTGVGTGDVMIYSAADPHPNLRASKMIGRRMATAMSPMLL